MTGRDPAPRLWADGLDGETYERLRTMVSLLEPERLAGNAERWQTMKRALHAGTGLLHVVLPQMAQAWTGVSGRAYQDHLRQRLRWMEAMADAAQRNVFANQQVHDALVEARDRFRELDGKGPQPGGDLMRKLAAGRTPHPSDVDTCQPEAVAVVRKLAEVYATYNDLLVQLPGPAEPRVVEPVGHLKPGHDGSTTPNPETGPRPATAAPGSAPRREPGPALAGRAGVERPPRHQPGPAIRPGGATAPAAANLAGVGAVDGKPTAEPARSAQLPGTTGTRDGSVSAPAVGTAAASTIGRAADGGGGQGKAPPGGGSPVAGTGGCDTRDRRRRRGGGDLVDGEGLFHVDKPTTPPVINAAQPAAAAAPPGAPEPLARTDGDAPESDVALREVRTGAVAGPDGSRVHVRRRHG